MSDPSWFGEGELVLTPGGLVRVTSKEPYYLSWKQGLATSGVKQLFGMGPFVRVKPVGKWFAKEHELHTKDLRRLEGSAKELRARSRNRKTKDGSSQGPNPSKAQGQEPNESGRSVAEREELHQKSRVSENPTQPRTQEIAYASGDVVGFPSGRIGTVFATDGDRVTVSMEGDGSPFVVNFSNRELGSLQVKARSAADLAVAHGVEPMGALAARPVTTTAPSVAEAVVTSVAQRLEEGANLAAKVAARVAVQTARLAATGARAAAKVPLVVIKLGMGL